VGISEFLPHKGCSCFCPALLASVSTACYCITAVKGSKQDNGKSRIRIATGYGVTEKMDFGNPGKKHIGLRIKGLRQERKMSMRELARKAGIAASYISKLEAGDASPTVVSLQKILNALNMDVYEFFRMSYENGVADRVVFSHSGMVASEDGERVWYYAFPKHPDIRMELTYEEYQPHTKIVEKESYRGDMCGYVLSGELTLEVINRGVFKARAGDAFYVKAGMLHAGRNDGEEVLKIVAVLQL